LFSGPIKFENDFVIKKLKGLIWSFVEEYSSGYSIQDPLSRNVEKSAGPLTPSIIKVFNKIKEKATQHNVDWSGAELYQVKGPWDDQVVVNLQQRVCSCKKWEVSCLDCKHAVACINNINENGLNGGFARELGSSLIQIIDLEGPILIQDQPYCWNTLLGEERMAIYHNSTKTTFVDWKASQKRKKSVVELDDLVRGVKLSKKGSTVTSNASTSGSQAASGSISQQEVAASQQKAPPSGQK
ncbi:mutator type transposase, partial [Tanacetum coccineum]